jgi:hypothetical protein
VLVHTCCEVEWEPRGNLTRSIGPEVRRKRNTGDSDGQLTSVSEVTGDGNDSGREGYATISQIIFQTVRLTVDTERRKVG